MAPEPRFFQASFSATLLRSAALAIVLLVSASPARSETLDLACASTVGAEHNIRVMIDTDRSTVTEIWSINGKSYQHAATISDQFIRYSEQGGGGSLRETTIDRIAGTMVAVIISGGGSTSGRSNYTCRRATQKF